MYASAYTQPIITSFTPTSGAIGTTVTISGKRFNAAATNNIVYFGAVKATLAFVGVHHSFCGWLHQQLYHPRIRQFINSIA